MDFRRLLNHCPEFFKIFPQFYFQELQTEPEKESEQRHVMLYWEVTVTVTPVQFSDSTEEWIHSVLQ
jgi:hypothetical protein